MEDKRHNGVELGQRRGGATRWGRDGCGDWE